jgi:hypothetical protein
LARESRLFHNPAGRAELDVASGFGGSYLGRVAARREKDELDAPLPLKPPDDPADARPTLAPPWIALLTAWLGLVTLIGFLVVPLLPGSRNPVEELQHHAWRPSDRWLPWPMYLSVVTLFLGIVVLRQMRKEPRPLDPGLAAQRVQAWVGMTLALIGIVFIYAYTAMRGPR